MLVSLLAWVSVFVSLAFIPPPARAETCPPDLKPHRPVRPKVLPRRMDYHSVFRYTMSELVLRPGTVGSLDLSTIP